MILYASQTHGKKNLQAMQDNNIRVLVTPDTYRGIKSLNWNNGTRFPFAMDNGAYGCHLKGVDFNMPKFEKMIHEAGSMADWVIAPDIVGGGLESLSMSTAWLKNYDKPALIAVQDGMTPSDVVEHLSNRVGIAIGGSTDWKLKNLPIWGKCAASVGCYLHVLRVNSRKRLQACKIAGAHSTDGTHATRYAYKARDMNRFQKEVDQQPTLGVWK